MKKLVAIFALFGFLIQTFSQVLIVGQYYANKEYIAKNLCENKDKPQLHCDGKCCLKKKLAKTGKDQSPSPRNQKNEHVVNLFCSDSKFELKQPLLIDVTVRYFNHNDLYTASFHHSVFHPPAA